MDVRDLIRRVLSESRDPHHIVIRSAGGGLSLRAYVDGYEIGHVTVESADGVRGHLGNLFVKPEHRGKGYGKALAGLAAQAVREAGFRRLDADVTSRRSYKALVSAFGQPTETAFESLNEIPDMSYLDTDGEGRPSESWAVVWDL